jgi:hypothetical protein
MFDTARTNETTRTPGYKCALAHILSQAPFSEWEKSHQRETLNNVLCFDFLQEVSGEANLAEPSRLQ